MLLMSKYRSQTTNHAKTNNLNYLIDLAFSKSIDSLSYYLK